MPCATLRHQPRISFAGDNCLLPRYSVHCYCIKMAARHRIWQVLRDLPVPRRKARKNAWWTRKPQRKKKKIAIGTQNETQIVHEFLTPPSRALFSLKIFPSFPSAISWNMRAIQNDSKLSIVYFCKKRGEKSAKNMLRAQFQLFEAFFLRLLPNGSRAQK